MYSQEKHKTYLSGLISARLRFKHIKKPSRALNALEPLHAGICLDKISRQIDEKYINISIRFYALRLFLFNIIIFIYTYARS
jgi:hypothetical protein